MGYSRYVKQGVMWMSGFRILSRMMAFLKIAVLARFLTPSQFGIFGIASLVLGLLDMLAETGINIFLIQLKENIDDYVDSAWVVSIIRGIGIGLLIVLLSPLIVLFFKAPDVYTILLLISLVPFVKGFINPSIITIQKELKFHYEFWFRSILFFIDAIVSIVFAVTTHSIYSIVFGMLAGAVLEVVLSFIFVRPIPKLRIRKDYFGEIFHKGKWVTAYGIFNYIAQEGDNIAVGRLLGPLELGIYQMAYKISTLPISEVTDVVSKVVFPVYAKIENEKERLKSAFLKSTLVISAITMLMGVIFFVFSQEVILIVLGDKWLSAVPVLKILTVYGVLRAIFGSCSALFLGVGKQNYVTVMTFTRFVGLIITIVPLITAYGMIGAGYSALFSVAVEIPIIIYFTVLIFKK